MSGQDQGVTDELIRALQNPALYTHPVERFSVIQTHISWVILTGSFAYKIKKPVNLGFADFSTLERRKYYCEEELRLNRRFASHLYLEVVTIGGSRSQPRLQAPGKAIEYALKMHQFPQSGLLGNLAAEHRLLPEHIDALGDLIAGFHERADHAGADTGFGTCSTFLKWCKENFDHIENALPRTLMPAGYAALKHWSLSPEPALQKAIDLRQDTGFVRECHGDLHLGNLALIDNQITLFDCIEFNEELRWIDTMSECAFLAMDLQARGYPEFAWRFLNRYLQAGGDYAGLALLRHYLVYRALVRAKVEALRQQAPGHGQSSNPDSYREASGYLDLAINWSSSARPALLLMHGFSGSGKSTCAKQLVESLGAIQLRSDIERKRLYGLKPQQPSGSGTSQGIYTEDASEATYRHLADLAHSMILSGYTVIVDASFLEYRQRDRFRHLACQCNIPYTLVSCAAPAEVLRQRIRKRSELGGDPSEATLEVLEHQLITHDPLRAEESVVFAASPASGKVLEADLVERLERLITTGPLDTTKPAQ